MFAMMLAAMLSCSDAYEWRPAAVPHVMELFRDGVKVGRYDLRAKIYVRYIDGDAVSIEPTQPPVDPPADCVEAKDDVCPNYGVDFDKISQSRHYSINGQSASEEEVANRMTGKLVDDSSKLFITVIGTPEFRKKVTDDWKTHKAFADVRSRYHFHDYAPDHPMVKCGFVTVNGVYCQAPGGKVIHRQEGYDGPEKLSEAAIESVRKVDPNYKPSADVNLNDPAEKIKGVPVIVWIAGGVALLLIAKAQQGKSEA